MNSHPFKGVFQPEELRSLQAIYDATVAQPWFPGSPDARSRFAKYLFATFPGETYNEHRHRAIVEASARTFYAVDKAF